MTNHPARITGLLVNENHCFIRLFINKECTIFRCPKRGNIVIIVTASVLFQLFQYHEL